MSHLNKKRRKISKIKKVNHHHHLNGCTIVSQVNPELRHSPGRQPVRPVRLHRDPLVLAAGVDTVLLRRGLYQGVACDEQKTNKPHDSPGAVLPAHLPLYQNTVPRSCGPCWMTHVMMISLPDLTKMSDGPSIRARSSTKNRERIKLVLVMCAQKYAQRAQLNWKVSLRP